MKIKKLQKTLHNLMDQNNGQPKIVGWVIKYSDGLIKDEKQANYVLLGFVVVAIVVMTVSFSRNGGSKAKLEAPPGQTIIYSENAPPRLQKRF